MAVAVARGHGNGHDAEGRQVVGQLGDCHGGAARIGFDFAQEKRRCGEARPQDVSTSKPTSTTRLLLALDRGALQL